MGQGTESCGGYDVDYDEYEECQDGYWIQRDGSQIAVSDMAVSHLRGALRIVEGMAKTSNFTGDAERWEDWAEGFRNEIHRRGEEERPEAVYVGPEFVKPTRGIKTQMICHCGTEYSARNADLKRGWAKSCSKRCASIRREFGRPAAKKKQIQAP